MGTSGYLGKQMLNKVTYTLFFKEKEGMHLDLIDWKESKIYI